MDRAEPEHLLGAKTGWIVLRRLPRSGAAQRLGAAGFTLVELMVVVAIVAILAEVALPAYTDYVTRSRIPQATDRLAQMQSQLDGYFVDHPSTGYAGALACSTDTTTSSYFTFSAICGATTYTAQAVGRGPMAGFTYTVDQAYNKTTTISANWTGWSGSTSCWITKKGGVC